MEPVPSSFYVASSLAVVYVLLLLRLGAYRVDREDPKAWWGAPKDVTTFLARDTYDERGQSLLTVVRIVLVLALASLGWMLYEFGAA